MEWYCTKVTVLTNHMDIEIAKQKFKQIDIYIIFLHDVYPEII